MNIFGFGSFFLILLSLLAGLAVPLPAAENVLITEFLAVNNTTLADEDGQYADWIELHNAHSNTVNLADWFLTDTTNNYIKWQFPATNLAANGYLVVFASGKDRRVPGARLHTSFALSSGGEYLALVKSNAVDGLVIVSEFSPAFPPQEADVSFGLGVVEGTNSLTFLTQGSAARARVPSGDIGTSWRGTNYDDSGWIAGPLGVGYDTTGTNLQGFIGTDVQAAMFGSNTTAYVRVPFNVSDPALFEELKLRLRYNDGFVAYLNGVEVGRRNAPANPQWNSATPALTENFDGPPGAYTLNTYSAAPGPSVQNANAGSTGKFLRLINDGVNNNINSITFDRVSQGVSDTIVADFDFRITNATQNPADGFSFMLIPTSIYGPTGAGLNNGSIASEEPNVSGVFGVGFDVYPRTEPRNDVSAHWNGTEFVNVTMADANINLTSGAFHHCKITLAHVSGGAYVTVTLTPNINLTPGPSYTPINAFFIPELNPYESRVQFAGRTGGLNMNVELDNIAVRFLAPIGSAAFTELDLSSQLGLLAPGPNVLALQGLTRATNDADFLILPELFARDLSFQASSRVYFEHPTPGAANDVASASGANKPLFSVNSGVFSNAFSLTLSSPSPTAQIHYTLDGSAPTTNSPLYTGPIAITNSTVARARAFDDGKFASPIAGEGYTFLGADVLNFSSNLPLIIINTLGQQPNDVVGLPRTPSYATFIDPHGRRAFLNSPPDFTTRMGIEVRGSSSTGFAKRQYRVEFVDEDESDRKHSPFGMPEDSDWILYAPYSEKSFLQNILAYELWEEMGHYSVRRQFVEVFLDASRGNLTAADYAGIYILVEKIKISKDRVNVAKLQPGDNAAPEVEGGYIIKKDRLDANDNFFTTSLGQQLGIHDPTVISPQQKAYINGYMNQFESALSGANFRSPTLGYAAYIDVDSFIDNQWLVEFCKNIDGYRLSEYMYKDRGGKLFSGPAWDYNLSFGNAYYNDGFNTNNFYAPIVGDADYPWRRRMFQDPDFNQKYIDRWDQLRTNQITVARLHGRVDELAALLNEAKDRDFARWPRLGTYIWPNPCPPPNNGALIPPNCPFYYALYQQEIDFLKSWIQGRIGWIDRNFLTAPAFSRNGGPITPGTVLNLTAPAGTIYYTLDGSDPRSPGGALNTNASVFTGPIVLNSNVRVFARALATNNWSAPRAATFVVATPTLTITELQYHPQKPPPGGTNYSDEDFEFIELKNTGGTAIDLTGFQFTDGVDFTFPSGGLQAAGSPTTQTFDGGGTVSTASTLGPPPGAAVTSGGPTGNLLHLVSQGNTTNRNRITFDQTAAGPYDKLTLDFDFRATNAGGAIPFGTNTTQNFDAPGTAFTPATFGGGYTPAVFPADAGSSGSFLRLTTNGLSQANTVSFDRTATGTWNTVVATFDFRMIPDPVTGSRADGMGFAFLNTANYGVTGLANVSYADEPNLAGTIGVGFDNYANAVPPTPLEPNNNHVSLHYNNAQVSPVAAIAAFDLASGRFHRAQVIIRFSGATAFVTVRITPDINGTAGPVQTLFDNYAIAGASAYQGRVGFGARTGGLFSSQDIDNLDVQYLNTPAPGGFSGLLLPYPPYGASGAGSALSSFTDEPTATNALALDFDFSHVSFINDAQIYFNRTQLVSTAVSPALLDFDNGLFHHVHAELLRQAAGAALTVTLTPDAFGTPGSPLNLFSNFLVTGMSPGNSRLELAGRAGGLNAAIDFDNINAQFYTNGPNLLAAGESIVIVRNRAAFESRYGTNGVRIAGEYGGSLDNGGEHLALVGRLGESIFDFSYSDSWYPGTDGYGFSLVRVDPNSPAGTLGQASSWRPSGQNGGSPGAVDPVPPIFSPVVINEILTTPLKLLTVELRNPSAATADVGGWLLLAEGAKAVTFTIPNGATIGPGGFLRLDFAPVDPEDFGYCPGGGRLSLFATDGATHLTGYAHSHEFGVVDAGVTLGRHITSVGEDHLVAQAANTMGTNNSPPLVGPLVLSEILYRPPDLLAPTYTQDDTFDEFIEVRNFTASPVNLFHPLYTSNTWRLARAVSFDFPPDTVIGPQSNILVVAFDPATDPAFLAAFRARYGIAPGVPIYGPYSGQLDNSSEALELQKPDAPLVPGDASVPHIVVDRVKYSDSAPWPVGADGYGLSLQRRVLSNYGDDPANWVAAMPTPGAGYPGGAAPSLVTEPQDLAQVSGSSVTLTAAATGDAPISYQWRFNGQNLPGETNPALSLPSIQRAHIGLYQVAAYNAAGSVVSTGAFLQVLIRPAFTQSPVNVTPRPGSNITFTVAATTDYPPLSYQWFFNGTTIPGATNASLLRSNIQLASEGLYVCAVADSLGLTNLASATMTVYITPALGLQPQNITVLQGADATFTASAFGNPFPLSFRWRKNPGGITLTNIVQFGTNSSITFANVQPYANAAFPNALTNGSIISVVATNLAGSSALSSSATLTVLADNDHDGIADDWERLYGFSTNSMADGFSDPDLDGMNNLQEYLAGTNPTNGLSYLKIDAIGLNGGFTNSVLTFSAVSNHSYSITYAEILPEGPWTILGSAEARATNRIVTLTNQASPGVLRRYYRLQTPKLQ